MFSYQATITNIVDGDTFDANVDLGFHIFVSLRFRLLGIDTAETWRPRNAAEKAHGEAATARVEDLMLFQAVTIYTHKAGKYGRWLADVILADGNNLTEILLSEGFQKKLSY